MDKMQMDVDPSAPKIYTRYYHPYFSRAEVETLSMKQRGHLSTSQEEKQRQQACAFIEAVGARIGLYAHSCMRFLIITLKFSYL